MKIRMMMAIIIFYIVTSIILVPLFTNLSHFFINLPNQAVAVKPNKPIPNMATNIFIIRKNILDVSNNLRFYFSIRNKAQLIMNGIRDLLIILGAYVVCTMFNRQYLNLCNRIDDIKSGDFSEKLIKGSYYPEMAKKLRELFSVLEKKRQREEEDFSQRNRMLDNAVEQFQRALANAQGKVEVVIEAESLEKGSQESIMLESAFESMRQMEDIVESIKMSIR